MLNPFRREKHRHTTSLLLLLLDNFNRFLTYMLNRSTLPRNIRGKASIKWQTLSSLIHLYLQHWWQQEKYWEHFL